MISWIGHQKYRQQTQNKQVGLHQTKKILHSKGNKGVKCSNLILSWRTCSKRVEVSLGLVSPCYYVTITLHFVFSQSILKITL